MNVNREELKFVKKKPGDTCKASLEKKDLSIVNTFRLVLNTLQNGLKYFLMDNFQCSVHLAQQHLQPQYGDGVFDNFNLSAGQH